ncbi:hypothetical protein BDB00DRAFT_301742 [Zychaea mexicana]|uniref:uncharacterized protein n=1 Tax=Zychaea mexicana TaxID=64656 RepID=UPI0022FE18AA|nr:uncharacterized protein BDB00DRAFT_301742 [Zychaea mexicana]KAI9494691.1 hypothetical protein BDB00DRAFT_301742 [Zychaea mexicana]
MELNNSMEKEDKLDASLVIKSDDNLSKQHRLSESSDETVQKEDPAVVLPPKPTKSKFIQRERKPPLRIQTMFDRHQLAAEQITQQNNKEVHEENALLLHARRNLKSAPSPPPLATVPSTSKSTSALHKLNSDNNSSSQDKAQESVDTAKRTSLQLQSSKSAQTTNRGVTPPSSNRAFLRQRQYDSNDEKPKKPRPLSDAFIGVKGLSKKFDSTTSESLASTKRSAKFFMRDEPPLLSTASQSVSRGRKTSTTTPTTAKAAAGVSALSQIFSSSSSSSSTGSQKEKSFKSKQSMRQYKALPPVKQPQQQSSNHNKKRIDPVTPTTVSMSLPTRSNSKKAESHRIFHKTMPAIPVTSSNSSDRSSPLLSRYPNPLPVYMPQLAQHPINDQQQSPEQIKVAETAIAPSSLSSTSSSSAAAAVEAVKPPSSSNSVTSAVPPVETSTAGAKKRVSFSSVITSIPPPSPFSDDESEDETNKRRPLMTMSSAHLLSQWQQKHEKGLRGTTTINPSSLPSRGNPSNNDTRGFWEAFSTEMNNRAAPGLRQAAVAKEKQQPTVSSSSPLPTTKTTTNRFIPSTYVKNSGGGKPLPPIVSNEKQQEQQPLSPRKTWINLLQDRLGKKSSSESILENSPPKALARPRPVWGMSAVPSAAAGESSSMNQHQQQQQNKKPAVASRKPVVAPLSFDDYPTSSTPPLHHVNVIDTEPL